MDRCHFQIGTIGPAPRAHTELIDIVSFISDLLCNDGNMASGMYSARSRPCVRERETELKIHDCNT